MSLPDVLPLAHALVARKDLPIPAWLFAWGASIVLIVSFFALSAAWREPRFEDEHWRPLGARLSRALLGIPAQVLCGAIGVFLLGVSVYTGHPRHRSAGSELLDHLPVRHRLARLPAVQRPVRQRLQAVQSLAGDRACWSAAASGRWPASAPPTSPTRSGSGRWPAAIGLMAFVWLEIVYGASGGVAVGLEPHAAGVAALLYSGYTFVDDGCCSGSRSGASAVRSSRSSSGCSRGSAASASAKGGSAGGGRSRPPPSGRRCPARRRS